MAVMLAPRTGSRRRWLTCVWVFGDLDVGPEVRAAHLVVVDAGVVQDLDQALLPAAEGERIHRAHADANAATNARTSGVIQNLLLERIAHHVDSHLAVARTFCASDAFVVGDDSKAAYAQLRVRLARQLHQLCQGTPVAAPHLAAEERIERDGEDAHQPHVREEVIGI